MPGVRHDLVKLLLVGVFAGAGGAANALLCFLQIPVPIPDYPEFRWLVIPGGAIHGAVLAMIPLVVAVATPRRPLLQLALAPVVGWVASYFSWIPLCRWAADATWADSLGWPLSEGAPEVLWLPFLYFGLVPLIYFLCLALGGSNRPAKWHIAYGGCAGVFGSLWWWIEWRTWYFALIHGTIWGVLTGLGASGLFQGTRSPVASMKTER